MINGWEWVIILVVVLLVFGVGRISKLGSELGKGVSAFRDGIKEANGEETAVDEVEVADTAAEWESCRVTGLQRSAVPRCRTCGAWDG